MNLAQLIDIVRDGTFTGFQPMDKMDYAAFAGAEPGSKIAGSRDLVLILSPDGRELEVIEDGPELAFTQFTVVS